MYIRKILLILSLVVLFSSCNLSDNTITTGSDPSNNSSEYSDSVDNSIIEEESSISDDSENTGDNHLNESDTGESEFTNSALDLIPEEYISALKSTSTFLFDFDNKDTYLKDYIEKFYPGATPYDSKVSILDLDNDGSIEIIVAMGGTGSIVLHLEDNVMYGYDFSYSALMSSSLKKDGSFPTSNGMSGSGWSTLEFDKINYQYTSIFEHSAERVGDNYIESYYYNGEELTKDEFTQLDKEQDNKDNADWYDFAELI